MDKLTEGSVHGLWAPTERTMRYPYTFTSQIRQFPYKWMFKNQWIFRYYLYGVVVAFPVFVSIHRMANSPANKKKWAEQLAKDAKEAAEHAAHRL